MSNPKALLAALALLIAGSALADVTQSTPSPITYTLKRGSTTVKPAGTAGTIDDCWAAARLDMAQRNTGTSQVITAYNCTLAIQNANETYMPAPVQCPSNQPADDSQQATAQCPAGTFGTYQYPQARNYSLFATPACWQPGTWTPATPPDPAPGVCSSTPPSGTYATTFGTPQTPISESGNWARANNAWTNVTTVDGFARGTNGITNSYDDSYAILQGAQYGSDYTITVTAARTAALPSAAVNEAEILIRCTDTPSSAKCIEISLIADGQVIPAVWNGGMGNFSALSNESSAAPQGKVTESTIFKATVAGSVLKVWRGAVLIFQNSHVPYATGNPGIGFFIRPGYVQAYGWRSFSVTTP